MGKIVLNYALISNVDIDGIDHRDAPDYVDAFILSAIYDGRAMTDEELDILNDDREYVYELVIERLH